MAHVQEKLIKRVNKNRTSSWSYICKLPNNYFAYFSFGKGNAFLDLRAVYSPPSPIYNLEVTLSVAKAILFCPTTS